MSSTTVELLPARPKSASSLDVRAVLAPGPILLFDGECGVCATSVQWILRHESADTLRFAALESAVGARLREAAGLQAGVDSLVWLELAPHTTEPRADIYSSAVIRALGYVGGPWQALRWSLWVVPKPLRDLGYRVFARFRRLVVAQRCAVPTSDQRTRFLEG